MATNQWEKHAALRVATKTACHALSTVRAQQPMGVATYTQQGTMHTRMEMNKQSTRLRSSLFIRDSGVSFVAHSRNEHQFENI